MYEKYVTMSLEVATLICRKHQRTIQKEYASHFWRLQIRMGFAEKYTWHTVGDPTLAQKIGSYSELVLGSFFGAQGSTTSCNMVPLGAMFRGYASFPAG